MAADIDPNYEYNECGKTGNYTQNSTYSDNLNILLSSLSNNVDDYGFYNGSVGQVSDRASAIVLCRGDVELSLCRGCVKDNAERITQLCPNQREAFRWYNICSIYYSDESIVGSLRTTPVTVQYSANTVQNPARFTQDLTTLVDRLRGQAVDGGAFLKYAADNTTGSDLRTTFAYVQCTPDLSVKSCNDCLITAFTQWSGSEGNDRIGARVLCPSCFFRYEISPFFGNTLNLIKNPPSTPSPPPPNSGDLTWNDDGNKGPKVIVIVVSIVAGLLIVLAICIFIIIRRRKKRKDKNYGEKKESQKLCSKDVEESSSGDEISPVESHLKYELITIQTATDNFSKANKVGEGRFGAVYKGKLENRQLVVAKRLSENSRQVNLEFKNEMALMARLQHRNLVRLLGYCQEGRTKILVYEFVPNGGLDSILFGNSSQACLSLWFGNLKQYLLSSMLTCRSCKTWMFGLGKTLQNHREHCQGACLFA
nr:putative receptor-like protein kinase At4g00960 [Ipomoea batatas]